MAQNRDSVSVANDPGDGDLHARLLAEIERREGACRGSLLPAKPPRLVPLDDVIEDHHAKEKLAYLAALRKVVELHRRNPLAKLPADDPCREYYNCDDECDECGNDWACPTIRAIAEALGVAL